MALDSYTNLHELADQVFGSIPYEDPDLTMAPDGSFVTRRELSAFDLVTRASWWLVDEIHFHNELELAPELRTGEFLARIVNIQRASEIGILKLVVCENDRILVARSPINYRFDPHSEAQAGMKVVDKYANRTRTSQA
jgi:hypothetical protein